MNRQDFCQYVQEKIKEIPCCTDVVCDSMTLHIQFNYEDYTQFFLGRFFDMYSRDVLDLDEVVEEILDIVRDETNHRS